MASDRDLSQSQPTIEYLMTDKNAATSRHFSPTSGSALRRDQYEMMRTHALLAEHTEARAEAIANHYTTYAQLAMELRKLTELRKRMGPSEDADKAIEMITDEIKAGHAKDLGIELLWQNVES